MCRRMYLKVRLAYVHSARGGTECQGHRLKVLTSQVILFTSSVVNT